jgi:hypothetical protein
MVSAKKPAFAAPAALLSAPRRVRPTAKGSSADNGR